MWVRSMQMNDVHFFFFQAEDGIRDIGVTGVQTCALPISRCSTKPGCANSRAFTSSRGGHTAWHSTAFLATKRSFSFFSCSFLALSLASNVSSQNFLRSEERRVGKECRYRWLT